MAAEQPATLTKYLTFALALLAVASGAYWHFRPSPAESRTTAPPPILAKPSEALPGEPVRPLAEPEGLDPARVLLGRQLFNDPRLSADNSLSCSSCHALDRGGADARPVSLGIGGAAGNINAPSVITATHNFRQFWDGRAATLEEQAGGPVVNPLEMASSWKQVMDKLSADQDLVQRFAQAYRDGLTPDNIRHAIAEFERSLARPSRFDRWLRGEARALDEAEATGYALFKKHGCGGCHQGINIGGNLYQRFGVMAPYFAGTAQNKADFGRYNVTGNEDDRYVFKVPSLRNVALTAPYFHNASAATLDEAVRIMGRYQLGLDLSRHDVEHIVAFLKTLNSEAAP